MQPIKFSGNCAEFPNFKNRLRDNLEDGLLTDSQKVEFLPKFVSGEAYEVIERASGCSYKDIVNILENRYGHPAAVANACIEKLFTRPKLAAGDNKGLRNFAEELEATSRKLQGDADAAKQLQLRGRKETVYVSTLLERKEEELEVVKFVLQSATGDGEKITVEEGLISQKFNINESLPENIDKNEHPHLADIVIPIVDIPRVSVVIGKDVDEAHEVLEVRLPTQPTNWIKNRPLQKNVEKAPEVQKRICQDDIERAKKRVAAIVQRKTYPDE
ncbi:hypothetical protein QZH41_006393, partial [Actinostola sp. cb2023]